MTDDAFVLAPYLDVLRAVTSRALRLVMLRPPYDAVGIGVLRVLRARSSDDRLELTIGYDGYAKLDATMKGVSRPSLS
ncbi:MAG TPA: hypothetical protein VGZ00_07175 [Candidatus Baltobacteraceae bacterium]|jgi:hypothetical protein|nr:hypothetical protein [Candidatus Baltobacteraceae bacterium]